MIGIGGRDFEEEALGGAAARDQQAGAREAFARHHDARADVEAAGHAVGLVDDFGADAEWLAADADGVADLRVQAQQHAVGDRDRIGLQSGAQIHAAD